VHDSAPPVSNAQIEGLRVLAPHLRRAAIISGLLDGRQQAAASFEATLAALGSGVVLVDEQLRVIYANERAEAMFAAGDPLVRTAGRLDLPRELVRGQLAAAVAAAARGSAGLQRGSGIPARLSDGGEAVVHVLPLGRHQATRSFAAVAAMFVAQPSRELNLPMEALQLLYQLRPAEARVFELIVRGLRAADIASTLGIAPSTVKTHTLRLFDKVGVHSRAQLAKLARDMSLGLNSFPGCRGRPAQGRRRKYSVVILPSRPTMSPHSIPAFSNVALKTSTPDWPTPLKLKPVSGPADLSSCATRSFCARASSARTGLIRP